MSKNMLTLHIIVLLVCFSFSLLQAINPFAARVITATNHKDFSDPSDYIHTVIDYYYSESDPPLADSINVTTQNCFNDQLETIYIHSVFEHDYQMVDGCAQVDYYEHRNSDPNLYAHFMFKWNADGDLIEVLQDRPTLDYHHIYLHYYNINQPDSILWLFGNASYPDRNYYRMYYDANGRLSYSYRYVYDDWDEIWYLYSRYILTYGAEPYQYPNPLDISNYRFYVLNGGGFEDSNAIFDKNYAPETIAFDVWNYAGEYWAPSNLSYYDVVLESNEIQLINGQYGDYYGRFIYNNSGMYFHKRVTYSDEAEVNYHLTWSNDVEAEDSTIPYPQKLLSLFPNPFRQNLTIRLIDTSKALNDVSIYNLKGQLVRSWQSVKTTELTWDGKDSNHQPVGSGIYLIKVRQGQQTYLAKALKN